MNKKSAPIIEYNEFDKNATLTCPSCNWQGKATGNIEIYERLFDVTCPKCDKILLIVNYP